MRDLDRLQEQDPDGRGRQVMVWLIVALLVFGLTVGVIAWNSTYKARLEEPDPLDQLVSAQMPRSRQVAAGTDAKKTPDSPRLTFQRRLTGEEERPEVIAALAAARREEEALAAAEDGEDDESAVPEVAKVPPAQMPAGLTASSGDKLEKAARHDPLVAAALPKAPNAHMRASSGADGEFILQVMSYEGKDEADAFASALRDRGHEAFVAAAHVDGRGRTYRVRIGPFKSKQAADAYRRGFEERERMNTIVVRRDD